MTENVKKSEAEWKQVLTREQFEITRNKGTELPFSGKYYKSHEKGMFLCACCGNELFSSEQKFDSGTGWPSFWAPRRKESISTKTDEGYGMVRTEVLCEKCDAHLGHVFEDGPAPTHLRYCINSAALDFAKEND